jgi:AraC-like DNA-binding protein
MAGEAGIAECDGYGIVHLRCAPFSGAQTSETDVGNRRFSSEERHPDVERGADPAEQTWVGRQRRWATPVRRGTIARVTSRSAAAAEHLRDLVLLRRVRDRIDREYAQPLDVEALARGAHMSAGHLSRQFRLAYGESPYSYLMTRRIERAMALLRRDDLSVTEVCFAVGCSSLGTFSTRFTELVGVPPSIYRRRSPGPTAGMPPCVAKQVTRPIRNREASAAEPSLT